MAVACALAFLVYVCRSAFQQRRQPNLYSHGTFPLPRRLSEHGGWDWQQGSFGVGSDTFGYILCEGEEEAALCSQPGFALPGEGAEGVRAGGWLSEQRAESERNRDVVVTPQRSRFRHSTLGFPGLGHDLHVVLPSLVELAEGGSSRAAQAMRVVRDSLRSALSLTMRSDTLRGNCQQRCRYARRMLNNTITALVSLNPEEAALVRADAGFISYAARQMRVLDLQLFSWLTTTVVYEEGIISQTQRTQVRATDLRELLLVTTERLGSRPNISLLREAINDLLAQQKFAAAFSREAKRLAALQGQVVAPGPATTPQAQAYLKDFKGVTHAHLKALMFPCRLLDTMEQIHRTVRSFPRHMSHELVELVEVLMGGVAQEVELAASYNAKLSSPVVVAPIVTVCSRMLFIVHTLPPAREAVELVLRTALKPNLRVVPRRLALEEALDHAGLRLGELTAFAKEVMDRAATDQLTTAAWLWQRVAELKRSLRDHQHQRSEDRAAILRTSSHDSGGPTQGALGMWKRMQSRWIRSQMIAIRCYEEDAAKSHLFFPGSWQPALHAAVTRTVFEQGDTGRAEEGAGLSGAAPQVEEGASAGAEESEEHSFLFLSLDRRWAPAKGLGDGQEGAAASSSVSPARLASNTKGQASAPRGARLSRDELVTEEVFLKAELRIPAPWTRVASEHHKRALVEQMQLLQNPPRTGSGPPFSTLAERQRWLLVEVARLLLPDKGKLTWELQKNQETPWSQTAAASGASSWALREEPPLRVPPRAFPAERSAAERQHVSHHRTQVGGGVDFLLGHGIPPGFSETPVTRPGGGPTTTTPVQRPQPPQPQQATLRADLGEEANAGFLFFPSGAHPPQQRQTLTFRGMRTPREGGDGGFSAEAPLGYGLSVPSFPPPVGKFQAPYLTSSISFSFSFPGRTVDEETLRRQRAFVEAPLVALDGRPSLPSVFYSGGPPQDVGASGGVRPRPFERLFSSLRPTPASVVAAHPPYPPPLVVVPSPLIPLSAPPVQGAAAVLAEPVYGGQSEAVAEDLSLRLSQVLTTSSLEGSEALQGEDWEKGETN